VISPSHPVELRDRTSFLRSVPVWVIVLICSGLPLAWLAWQIIASPAVLVEAVPDAFRMKLLGRTLLFNGGSAAIATLLGLPVGMVLGRGRGVVAKALWVALPVSLLLPSVTYAYGWSQFLRLMDATPAPAGAADVFRCVWTLATWLWPIPAAMVGLALRRLDVQLQLQALLDGALWRVTFRELAGVVASATMLCAVLATQEFAVYEPTGISVIATEVRMVFETGAFASPANPITAPVSGQGIFSVSASDQGSRAAAAVAASPTIGSSIRWVTSRPLKACNRKGKKPNAIVCRWNIRWRPTRCDELPTPLRNRNLGGSNAPPAITTARAVTTCSAPSASR
jgi:ABC-type spermidine/putrescine transport system permease subunit II